ncbi:hypothetical protein ABMA27_014920 [Loxostege sticticalis]|uniref:THAP-type domain-containing protein n=1 Tax=Loxostege sticticalis TaxID=481309 RepID=A0ABR3IAN3_LOXSC
MSQSKAKCCVPGCSISGRSHRVLHGYPNYVKEPERFRSWIYAVGGDILGLSDEHIYKNRRVCHSHFEAKYCLRNNRISAIAIPTLNLLGISSIPRFHFGEDRPVRKLQISSTYASTSKGLKVIATVCDQGTNNRQALKYLLEKRRATCLRKGKKESVPSIKNWVIHTPATNCENDYAAALHSFLIPEENKMEVTHHEVDFNDIITTLTPVSEKNDPKIMAPLIYVSGYIVKKTKQRIYKNCYQCKSHKSHKKVIKVIYFCK